MRILFLTLMFSSVLFSNVGLVEYNDAVHEELGMLAILIDGFSINNNGILSFSFSFYSYLAFVSIPLLSFFLVRKFFNGPYNEIIVPLSILAILLILALGVSGSAPSVQKAYEKKLSEKYNIKQPFSIFFSSDKD